MIQIKPSIISKVQCIKSYKTNTSLTPIALARQAHLLTTRAKTNTNLRPIALTRQACESLTTQAIALAQFVENINKTS